MSTEQKPETEARRVAQRISERYGGGRFNDAQGAMADEIEAALAAKDVTILTVHYESIIAALNAEIERLTEASAQLRSATLGVGLGGRLMTDKLKAQTALLVEACYFLKQEIAIGRSLGYTVSPDWHKFLSRPDVAALLAGKENS